MKVRRFRSIPRLGGYLVLALSTGAPAQEAHSETLRLGFVKVKSNGYYEWQEATKIVNEGYRKAGVPWRHVWVSSIFGEMGSYVTVAPVKSMAQFDQGSPMSKLTEADRSKYMTLMRDAIEESRYLLVQFVPSLSLESKRKDPPKLARVTVVKTKAGKALEFEQLVKDTMLPAYRKAEVRDYWVHRTVLGGSMGEYQIVHLFDKWQEMDGWLPGEKLFGGRQAFERFLGRIHQTVDSGENLVIRAIPELSYQAPE